MLEITGRKFNHLEVLEFSYSKNQLTYWKCRCDCGKECIRLGKSIKSGLTKSCGHLHKENVARGAGHYAWKGDNVGYFGIHVWARKHIPKPKTCLRCDRKPNDLANISQKYKRDASDWEWLCRSCHMKSDGRFKNLRNQT